MIFMILSARPKVNLFAAAPKLDKLLFPRLQLRQLVKFVDKLTKHYNTSPFDTRERQVG